MYMKLSFAFSPCPNDTFMFEPLVNSRIDSGEFQLKFILDDVENLNKAALREIPDITKLSFNAYTKIHDKYQLLTSGSALGNNCGPLLISKNKMNIDEVDNLKIAIPGFNTTAYLLLKYAFPNVDDVKEMLFSDIEDAVLSGEADAGVIIHENRFTYKQRGLHKIIDLGEYWETKTGSPIPLGGIAIKRSLPQNIKLSINDLIYKSIKFAFENPDSGTEFIKSHAQEMDQQVILAHIRLYVNKYSQNLGVSGRNAVFTLFKTVHPDISSQLLDDIFVK